ncbi:MAG: NAD-dependent epimerase/dehydratase family protein [Betaproteobacteria bacterium]|nr:NAD-dependent epimerase/dehydratase family protein [Betaproteobacteria bacterium]
MTHFREILGAGERRWLVTGGAGFIGSHLVEELLLAGQRVTTLDNFSTGKARNLEDVRRSVGEANWGRHRLIEGDVRSLETCKRACDGAEFVLHQAALGSVPRSIADPIASNDSNVTGFLNMLVAAKEASVNRFVYASSSSVYGDHPGLPKVEDSIGTPLSPYAVTKRVNELYASVFSTTYDIATVGLRYFNVFGARQDPDGPYAAVIPRWIQAMLAGASVRIFGDGETSRDFCYVKNVVQANLRAATVDAEAVHGQIFNVAVSQRVSLNGLFELIRQLLARSCPDVANATAVHEDFRKGDVRHSLADISKARERLAYRPTHELAEGLAEALPWYIASMTSAEDEAV